MLTFRRLAPVLLLAAACTTRYVATDRGPQAYYQTGFPIHDTSVELQRILRSVKRIHVTGYYTTFRFDRADSITAADLRQRATYGRAVDRFSFDHSKAGTATILGSTAVSLTLITNDHVTRMPDTLIVHYPDTLAAARDRPRIVESVSIRTALRYLVIGLPDTRPFTVLARDSAADVAALSVAMPAGHDPTQVPVLRARLGDPGRLVWGSFVYVLGYPRGYRMVTRAIVSEPDRRPDNAFLLDGLFNPGISGGLILAVRGDTGALEWVGIATAASASSEFILLPSRETIEEYGVVVPYEGGLHLERVSRIDYGITFSVPLTTIRRFLRRAGLDFLS